MNNIILEYPIPNTENGKFVINDDVNRIMFDIGASYHAPNTKKNLNKETFVVTVEPDPRMWISYLSMWYHTQPLWKPSHAPYHLDDAIEPSLLDNFAFLPCAVGMENGFLEYNLSVRDGKSSILESNVEYEKHQPQFKKIPVKVITLSDIIDMVPEDRRINMIKIDCQGYDDRVVLSGKDQLYRVDFLSVEIGEHESNQYLNAYDVSSFRMMLKDLGFVEMHHSGGLVIFKNKKSKNDFTFDVS